MKRKVFSILAILVFCSAFTNAAIVEVKVTATVTDQSQLDYFNGDINVADTLTMIYSYDTEVIDGYSWSINAGEYRQNMNLSVEVSNLKFQSNTNYSIVIYNDCDGPNLGPYDKYLIDSHVNLPINGNGTSDYVIGWDCVDYTASIFSNDHLPTDIIPIQNWSLSEINITGPRSAFVISASVTNIEAIPEPMTFAILGLGGILLKRSRK